MMNVVRVVLTLLCKKGSKVQCVEASTIDSVPVSSLRRLSPAPAYQMIVDGVEPHAGPLYPPAHRQGVWCSVVWCAGCTQYHLQSESITQRTFPLLHFSSSISFLFRLLPSFLYLPFPSLHRPPQRTPSTDLLNGPPQRTCCFLSMASFCAFFSASRPAANAF